MLALVVACGCARITPAPRGAAAPRREPDRASQAELAAGVTEVLELASRRAVGRTGRDGGFREQARIRLRLPDELGDLVEALKPMGMGSPLHVLELAMNRAAERAAGQALPVLDDAIATLPLEDAAELLRGPDDAATRALRTRAGPAIDERFAPIVDQSMREVGLIQAYDQLLTQYRALPSYRDPALDLVGYVTDATLEGLYRVLAEEERRIRSEPEARTGERLRQLLGGSTPSGA